MTQPSTALLRLVQRLNERARATMLEDGGHAPMFVLVLPDGRVDARLFEAEPDGPVVAARSREMAAAVGAARAVAVAFVSEAWSAPRAAVERALVAGEDSPTSDLLLVAGTEAEGGLVVYETDVSFAGDVGLGESVRYTADFEVRTFDGVRDVWRRAAGHQPDEAVG